jgi:hypothetical protein
MRSSMNSDLRAVVDFHLLGEDHPQPPDFTRRISAAAVDRR